MKLFKLLIALLVSTSIHAGVITPKTPVELIVPFPAGGSIDFIARALQQELQTKALEPGTKAQVELRIEQMKTRDSLQSLINKGINPVTTAMQKLAGATETVVGVVPGTTPATGAQIGGGTSPGVVSGKSVTIGGQTRSGGDRNWRNNNPGNIEYGPFAMKYGATGSDGRFAIFPTEEQGRMAQDALLKSKNYVRNN